MTAVQTSVSGRVDAALDEIQLARVEVMARPDGVERSVRMAGLCDHEARCWSVLFERSNTRAHWRAALNAREHAQQMARAWRRRAGLQRTQESAPQRAAATAA